MTSVRIAQVLLVSFLLGGLLLSTTGCTSPQGVVVEGTVTIDGTPANSGEVVFANDKERFSAPIQRDGSYKANGAPLGQVSVTVQSATAPKMQGGMPEVKDMGKAGGAVNPVPIPPKYAAKETSGFSTTLKHGVNQYPIQLTAK